MRDAHTFTYFCSLGGVIAALFRQEVQGVENVDMEALWMEHCGLCRYLAQRNGRIYGARRRSPAVQRRRGIEKPPRLRWAVSVGCV